MLSSNRIGIFADVPSLWFWAREYGQQVLGRPGAKVNYTKLRSVLAAGERDIVDCRAYVEFRTGVDLHAFCVKLKHCGYDVVELDHGAAIDEVATDDIIESSRDWDTLVLATCEGRYSRLFRELKALGKHVELRMFPIECPVAAFKSQVDSVEMLNESVLFEA